MKQYLDVMRDIIEHGEYRKPPEDHETVVGSYSLFGPQLEFMLRDGFPLMTTKKLHWKSIVHELLWFLRGDTNIKYLNDNGVSIWNEWADDEGELGPVYGKQWRRWSRNEHISCGEFDSSYVDQISELVYAIKNTPHSRRLIVSTWNVGDLPRMALPPCHVMFQMYVSADRFLDCKMYQRSADWFLGVPFNIASYALLTYMIAHATNLQPRRLITTFGDAHLYENHIDQAKEQLTREPGRLPRVYIQPEARQTIDGITHDDIRLIQYDPHPHISAPISK
jgi:thymidylate synthase